MQLQAVSLRRKEGEILKTEKDTVAVRDMMEVNEKGQIKQNIHNCMTAFLYDPHLKGAICHNILTGMTDIVRPLGWKRNSAGMTDTDMHYLLLYLEENYDLTNEKKIQSAIKIVANENKYHPIRDYLNALQWDGQERVCFALNRFLGADVNDYTHEAMRLFMLGAVNRVFHPGCKFEYMLCLVGGQGAGKSTFFRFLAINDEWFSDDLRKLEDDNVYRKLQGHWIMEMSEMIATASAKSIEEIKAFLSRQKETYKIPYEVHPEDRPRQCVFAGTSNTMDFLPLDRTGNRRFLPVIIHPENAMVHILEQEKEAREYMIQMWAEIMDIYRSGAYELRLKPEVQIYVEKMQRDFMPEDSKAGIVQAFLDNYTDDYVCSLIIYREALNNAYDKPKQWELREIGDIMNNSIEGWEPAAQHRFSEPYGRQRSWRRVTKDQELEDDFKDLPKQMRLPFDEPGTENDTC